ncbi:MAG TPA: hypothetical protein ENH23_05910 [candidate division Zixibacteria bacterium]|nr:hypothetical protein [candidate division Zixibacteria bacterium]
MKLIELLIGSQSFWAIVGVILGVALGEGIRWVRHCQRICTLKKIVCEELRSIKNQLIQKKDIINQAIDHLQKKALMSTMSVRLLGRGYQENIGELYIHLSDLERNCLHVIFERLRIADDLLDSLENNFMTAVKEKS